MDLQRPSFSPSRQFLLQRFLGALPPPLPASGGAAPSFKSLTDGVRTLDCFSLRHRLCSGQPPFHWSGKNKASQSTCSGPPCVIVCIPDAATITGCRQNKWTNHEELPYVIIGIRVTWLRSRAPDTWNYGRGNRNGSWTSGGLQGEVRRGGAEPEQWAAR